MTVRALIVAVDPDTRFLAATVLRDAVSGIRISEASDAVAFTAALDLPDLRVAVVARDLKWADGLELIKLLHHRHPACATILVGAMPADLTDPEQQPDAFLSDGTAGMARIGQVAVRTMERRGRMPRAALGAPALDALPVAVLELAADERVLSANARAMSLLGTDSASALAGKAFTDLISLGEGGQDSVSLVSRAAATEDGLRVTVLPVHGLPVECRLLVRPRTADGVLGGFVVSLLPSSAQTGNDTSSLLYAVSHDLQQPLATTARTAQMLSDKLKAQGTLGGDEERMLRRILSGTGRMEALMTGLMDYVRTGQNPLKRETFELASACEEAVQSLQGRLEEAKALVRWRDLPRIRASRPEMVRLLENLLANAIKFRGPDRPVIDISCADRQGSWVLAVKDNGLGVDPGDAQRIFQPFHRLHTESEYPGTGIGLAICRQICERHGGRIWVTPNPDRGSTFFATISKDSDNDSA